MAPLQQDIMISLLFQRQIRGKSLTGMTEIFDRTCNITEHATTVLGWL